MCYSGMLMSGKLSISFSSVRTNAGDVVLHRWWPNNNNLADFDLPLCQPISLFNALTTCWYSTMNFHNIHVTQSVASMQASKMGPHRYSASLSVANDCTPIRNKNGVWVFVTPIQSAEYAEEISEFARCVFVFKCLSWFLQILIVNTKYQKVR